MTLVGACARVAIVGVFAGLFVGCCGAPSLGTPCIIPPGGEGVGVRVVSPALECHSRLCLVTDGDAGTTASCTVECSSDSDCDGSFYCVHGSICATVAGFPRSVCTCQRGR